MFLRRLEQGNANLTEIPKSVAVKLLKELIEKEKEKNARRVDSYCQTKA